MTTIYFYAIADALLFEAFIFSCSWLWFPDIPSVIGPMPALTVCLAILIVRSYVDGTVPLPSLGWFFDIFQAFAILGRCYTLRLILYKRTVSIISYGIIMFFFGKYFSTSWNPTISEYKRLLREGKLEEATLLLTNSVAQAQSLSSDAESAFMAGSKFRIWMIRALNHFLSSFCLVPELVEFFRDDEDDLLLTRLILRTMICRLFGDQFWSTELSYCEFLANPTAYSQHWAPKAEKPNPKWLCEALGLEWRWDRVFDYDSAYDIYIKRISNVHNSSEEVVDESEKNTPVDDRYTLQAGLHSRYTQPTVPFRKNSKQLIKQKIALMASRLSEHQKKYKIEIAVLTSVKRAHQKKFKQIKTTGFIEDATMLKRMSVVHRISKEGFMVKDFDEECFGLNHVYKNFYNLRPFELDNSEKTQPQAGILGFDERSSQIFEDFNNNIKNLMSKMPDHNQIDKFTKLADNATSRLTVDLPLTIAFGASAIYYVHNPSRDKAMILASIGTVILVKNLTSSENVEFVQSCVKMAMDFCTKKNEKIVSQSAPSRGCVKDVLSSLIFMYYTTVVGSKPDQGVVDKMVGSASMFGKNIDNIQKACDFMLKISQSIYEFVARRILGSDATILFTEDNVEVDAFIAECMSVFDKAFNDRLELNRTNADMVFSLWSKGNIILSKVGNSRDMSIIKSKLQGMMNELTKLKAKFEVTKHGAATVRFIPITTLIMGESDVGKSYLTSPLVSAVLSKVLTKEELVDFKKTSAPFVYSRVNEHKYWDGYFGQMAVIFDDFGQIRDAVGMTETEYMEIIRCKNIFGYICHMAGLESKGVTTFRSKLIFCTTNLHKIAPESIINAEAVTRRFDLVVKHVPPVKFSKDGTTNSGLAARRLDSSKIPRESVICRDAVEYHVHDLATGTDTGQVFTFDGLVDHIVSLYRKEEAKFSKYSDSLSDMIDESINDRFPVLEKVVPQGGYLTTIREEEESDDEIIFETGDTEANEYPDFLMKFPPLIRAAISDKIIALCHIYGYRFLNTQVFFDAVRRYRPLEYDRVVRTSKISKISEYIDQVFLQDLIDWRSILLTAKMNEEDAPRVEEEFLSLRNLFAQTKDYLESLLLSKCPNLYLYMKINPARSALFVTVAMSVLSYWASIAIPVAFRAVASVCKILGFGDYQEEDIVPESPSNKTKFSERKTKHDFKREISMLKGSATAQGYKPTRDPTNRDIMRKVYNNVYEIKVNFCDGRLGLGMFIQGRVLMIPFHYLMLVVSEAEADSLTKEKMVILDKVVGDMTYEFPIAEFLKYKQTKSLDDNDICLVELPKAIKNHANILPFFCTRKDAYRTDEFDIYIDDYDHGSLTSTITQAMAIDNFDVTGNEYEYVIRKGYFYRAATYQGMCGSIVSVINPACPKGKIIGVHTAGRVGQGVGFCSSVTQEDVEEGMQLFSKQVLEEVIEDHIGAKAQHGLHLGRFAVVQNLDKAVSLPSFTKLMESKLFEAWGPSTTKPANLTSLPLPGEEFSPFEKVMRSYMTHAKWHNPQNVDLVVHSYVDFLKRSPFDFVDMELTYEQAILGIDGDPCFTSIPRNTSAGYPHNLRNIPGKPGKERFFGSGDKYDLTGAEAVLLKERVFKYIAMMEEGVKPPLFYTDYKKDERLPVAKVDAGKIRMISAAPLEMVVIFRMYFGSFSKFLIENKLHNGITMGINYYSSEWNQLALLLLAKSTGMFAGDFKGYDKTHQEWMLWAVHSVMSRFYQRGGKADTVREVLWHYVTNAFHVYGNIVYEVHGTNPSGGPLTSQINNITNHIAHRYSYFILHGYDTMSLIHYEKHICLQTHGDDSVGSVSAEKAALFNEVALEETMKVIGYTYTSDLKDGSLNLTRDISQVTFLKRSFVYAEDVARYVAPLNLDVILEIPYWTKDVSFRDTITADNVDVSLMELSLHGEAVFDLYAPKIISAFRKRYGKHPTVTNYVLLRVKCLARNEYW